MAKLSTNRPIFTPFDPEKDLRVYVRNLPHWRQPGATYFVTFRQDDSIPKAVLTEWLDVRGRWYRAHSIDPTWKQTDSQRFGKAYSAIPREVRRAFERKQAKMLHEELDRCHGSCVLRHPAARKIVRDAITFFHGRRLWMGDIVVMPNHVHAILIPYDEWELEDLLGSIKKWSARLIGRWLDDQPQAFRSEGPVRSKPQFWQHESYDRIVRDKKELAAFRKYTAMNPETAKLAEKEYTYQSADWLDEFAAQS